jgi:hypothetical protein
MWCWSSLAQVSSATKGQMPPPTMPATPRWPRLQASSSHFPHPRAHAAGPAGGIGPAGERLLCWDHDLGIRLGFPVIHFHPSVHYAPDQQWACVCPQPSHAAMPCSQVQCAAPLSSSSSHTHPSAASQPDRLQRSQGGLCHSPLPHAAAGIGLVWVCVRGFVNGLGCSLGPAQRSCEAAGSVAAGSVMSDKCLTGYRSLDPTYLGAVPPCTAIW